MRDNTGAITNVDADALFVLIGARPHTSSLPAEIGRDEHGFVLTGADGSSAGSRPAWSPARPPVMFETSLPGVLAVGDIRSPR